MKTIAGTLADLNVVAWRLTATPGVSQPFPSARGTPIGGATFRGSAVDAQGAKRQAQDFIQQSRQALARNDLPTATYWYRKAVQQRAAFSAGEYSPRQLAAEIRRQGGDVAAPAAGNPAGHGTLRHLPPIDQVSQMPPSPSQATGDRAKALEALGRARLALAGGDFREADRRINQALGLQTRYQPGDDTPAAVGALVEKARQVRDMSASQSNTENYRRKYAQVLLEQADGLLRCGEFDAAEQLANLAAKHRTDYGAFELKPQKVLDQIAAARRGVARPSAGMPTGGSVSGPTHSVAAKRQALDTLRQARAAMEQGDLRRAEYLARDVQQMRIPSSAFGPGEDRAELVLTAIENARRRVDTQVMPAGGQGVIPAAGRVDPNRVATRAVYDPARDNTRNQRAAAWQTGENDLQVAPRPFDPRQQPIAPGPHPVPAPSGPSGTSADSRGLTLFMQGESALRAHRTEQAMEYFRQAAQYQRELDPLTNQRLQGYLQGLTVVGSPATPGIPNRSMADDTAVRQQVLAKTLSAEVMQKQMASRNMLETDPNGAIALLEEVRRKIEGSGVEPAVRRQLMARLDRSLENVREFLNNNRPRIELEEQNQQVMDDVERSRRVRLEIQQKLKTMVDQYNELMEEQRFGEAEKIAQEAAEMAPDEPVVVQLVQQSRILRRLQNGRRMRDEMERGIVHAFEEVDRTGIPPIGDYLFPENWQDITRNRAETNARMERRSPGALEIEKKLKQPVLVQYRNQPLGMVIEDLARVAQINIFIDQQGLLQEGVATDHMVSLDMPNEITLGSALNTLLGPLHLAHVIKDEVLRITSEELAGGEVYTKSYPVADLVIPIPNFVPTSRMGLGAAYNSAMGNLGYASTGNFDAAGPSVAVASRAGGQSSGSIHPSILAQMPINQGGGGVQSGSQQPMPFGFGGPGGMGGGPQADFDSLEELITTTVAPETWEEVGGPGTISHLETNLSLVVRQTQEVHEEVAELLEQLRRMQDLQVTIEVRFITLNDNFFERIGVDFDFDINDNIDRPFQVFGRPDTSQSTEYTQGPQGHGADYPRDYLDRDNDANVAVGLDLPGIFSADLDIPFRQDSFTLAQPQFGGFAPDAGAQLGFAILSDIEAFFFINAAQGDRRSNVLQAPKVTLFNGQQAFVSDTSQSPFVISVVPVVGDFAAAQQPVIVVLSEGTFLTVQAVVSNDRRFVRLTVVPFFSEIKEVNTFTFEGSTTTTDDSSIEGNQDEPNDNSSSSNNSSTTRSGTTVQLPTFSFITVTTTVSVPDGGTVLLGGIKRLSEGRNEFGVPILNKIPYINRLFKNVGIGRETQSLMMMVTPRIIIQEEEEAALGISVP